MVHDISLRDSDSGDLESRKELIQLAKAIANDTKELIKLAKAAANACTDRRLKQVAFLFFKIVSGIFKFL